MISRCPSGTFNVRVFAVKVVLAFERYLRLRETKDSSREPPFLVCPATGAPWSGIVNTGGKMVGEGDGEFQSLYFFDVLTIFPR